VLAGARGAHPNQCQLRGNILLFPIYFLPCTFYGLRSTVCYLLPAVCCLLPTVYCLVSIHCFLPTHQCASQVQEAIIVTKDIFRKYPDQYESVISTLCENLETLDEPAAKAAMVLPCLVFFRNFCRSCRSLVIVGVFLLLA
jgi:hypothetical protein